RLEAGAKDNRTLCDGKNYIRFSTGLSRLPSRRHGHPRPICQCVFRKTWRSLRDRDYFGRHYSTIPAATRFQALRLKDSFLRSPPYCSWHHLEQGGCGHPGNDPERADATVRAGDILPELGGAGNIDRPDRCHHLPFRTGSTLVPAASEGAVRVE